MPRWYTKEPTPLMARWLFLDMNAFFASVEQQERPALRGRPVAVVPMLADTTCCIAASYEAKAFGVKTGTSVRDARRFCPHIHFVEAAHGPYRAYHAEILRVVSDCLPEPRVLSVDEMVCKLWTNEAHLWDALHLGDHIKTQIRARVGEWLHCSVGIGPNPFLAKVAAEMQKPNGLVTLEPEDLPRKLYRLALTDFPGIGGRMEKRFHAAGVHTTEQMYALPCAEMRRLWGGVRGEQWWHLLRGHRVAEPPAVRRSVGHSHVLPPELRTRRGADAVVLRLLEKAAARMRGEGLCARGLCAWARGGPGEAWERAVRLSPSADTWTLAEALWSVWEHPFIQPHQVGVVLNNLVPLRDVTLPLFGDAERRLRGAGAVDALNARFGRGTVGLAGAWAARHIAQDKIAFARIGED